MNIDPKSETPDLQKCKDAVAKKHGEESWSSMEAMYFDNNGICTINTALYWEVAELYADTLQSENQRLTEELKYLRESKDGYIQDAVELRSLKQSILESGLKKHFPEREMSFHDKVVLAIGKQNEINEELVSFLEEMQDSNYPGCNHTIPGQWKNKGKELIEKSKPLNHEQSRP